MQATCDAANADEERNKWLEVEVQRLKHKSDGLEQQLATSRKAALAMVARIEQLEVGTSASAAATAGIYSLVCCASAASCNQTYHNSCH